jgi:hypothetical protein
MNPMSIFQDSYLSQGFITEDVFVNLARELGVGMMGRFAVRQVFKQLDRDADGKLALSDALIGFETLKNRYTKREGAEANKDEADAQKRDDLSKENDDQYNFNDASSFKDDDC